MMDNAGDFAATLFLNFHANNAVNFSANEFATRSRPDDGPA